MIGETRWRVVTPLLVIFGCKLAVTGCFLWLLTSAWSGHDYVIPLSLAFIALGTLAGLQIYVIGGVMLRRGTARTVADRLCFVGLVLGCLLFAGSPLMAYFGVFGFAVGLLFMILNTVALLLVSSAPMREWCDVAGKPFRPRLVGFEPEVGFKAGGPPEGTTRRQDGLTRWTVVAPLVGFFAGKLLATGYLVMILARSTSGSPWVFLIVVPLGALVVLQAFVAVGVSLRRNWARDLGDRVCSAGAFLAAVMVVLGPLTLYLAFFVIGLGLILFFLNGAALFLLRARAMRDWCDVGPEG